MNTHTDRSHEKASRALANNLSGQKKQSSPGLRSVETKQGELQRMASRSPQMLQMKTYQAMADNYSAMAHPPVQRKENQTGLPDTLKSGIENLSGYSMDDVNVHFNSGKPAQLQALAYAQGTDIHIAPGQEKHLPHEAWHVVQQKQGRVRPTMQAQGAGINNDAGLEQEADTKATQLIKPAPVVHTQLKANQADTPVIQAVLEGTNWNLISQEFRQGLIHGHYRPPTNLADMHVDQANEENPHATAAHMLAVMEDVYQAMAANYAETEKVGTLDWRPTGSAVVKMVGELLGEAFGGSWNKFKARALKVKRKKFGRAPEGGRDEIVMSKDIVPEHMAYMKALQGGETIMTTVIPGESRAKMEAFMQDNPQATEDEMQQFQAALETQESQNMLEDSDAGRARLAQYQSSLESGGNTLEDGGMPVSLNVQLKHTQLPAIIAVLRSMN